MQPHRTVEYSGAIAEVFAHRFVLATAAGNILADLGANGAKLFALKKGDRVHIAGEKRPSEVKVHAIAHEGEPTVVIEHAEPPPHHEHADPLIALRAADQAGFTPLGEPHRKAKYFELRARDARGQAFELHIELDGRIAKQKPIGVA
ncbi:hypothetical protein [Methylocella sp.]|jgi:hypothetical protein|uniref:hypothetical protein n=1 Tax=Methylocella sp. TaxID=1978226 RepID=UPI003C1B7AEF